MGYVTQEQQIAYTKTILHHHFAVWESGIKNCEFVIGNLQSMKMLESSFRHLKVNSATKVFFAIK